MGARGRLRLRPILRPAWPSADLLWSRSDSGRVAIGVSGPLALHVATAADDSPITWPDLHVLIPQLTPESAVTALTALDYQESWRVLLGFDDGHVAVLDSDRALLFCHVLCRDRVLGFRCRPLYRNLDRHDIIVRYPDRMVFLDGSSFTDLCNRYADYDVAGDESNDDPLRFLQFHKFSVAGQNSVHDVVFCDASISIDRQLSVDPHMFQFITVGSPSFNMITLAECNRNRPPNEVIAVAVRQGVDVARKIASNFFAFGKKILIESGDEPQNDNIVNGSTEAAEKGLIERASTYTVNPVATIGDIPNRIIQSIVVDDRQKWAACIDNLGRTLLLDLRQFLFVRIWKGYRDAQIAFMRGNAENVPLMLVIYVSNIEIIEVWEIPFGEKIAAKKIGKGHRLQSHKEAPLLLHSDGSVLFTVSIEAVPCTQVPDCSSAASKGSTEKG